MHQSSSFYLNLLRKKHPGSSACNGMPPGTPHHLFPSPDFFFFISFHMARPAVSRHHGVGWLRQPVCALGALLLTTKGPNFLKFTLGSAAVLQHLVDVTYPCSPLCTALINMFMWAVQRLTCPFNKSKKPLLVSWLWYVKSWPALWEQHTWVLDKRKGGTGAAFACTPSAWAY